ncbi:MAG: protein phosphatase 2C domain-containing protein [Deltaproteobacteria bacterium]|nr:protein phosphatase 2C domain-containing protein [Deltaproteobacteria bacterium]
MPCQDAASVACSGLPVVAALADGLGSAARSEAGAHIAVATAVQLLASRFTALAMLPPQGIAEALVAEVTARIDEAARDAGEERRHFASTLMFVATDGVTLVAGSLGDGVVSRQGTDGRSRVLFRPKRGEHANETFPVTSIGAAAHMQVTVEPLGGALGFALFSDGAAEALYQRKRDEIAPAVDTLLGWLELATPTEVSAALANSLGGVVSEKTTDDCSIALLRRVELASVSPDKRELRAVMLAANPRSSVHLRNRLLALEFWERAASGVPEGMSPSTYRRHAAWLAKHFVREPGRS